MRTDPAGTPKVLGYDAAGTVEAVGTAVTLFKPGDEVYYAGSNVRPGTDSEYHAVDERIVGRKPKNLSFAEAAALPLTTITAWELLFDRIGVKPGEEADKRTVLIVGGSGGVGSIAIQIARAVTGLTIIATASRPETVDWVNQLGAHYVIDHSKPMAPQLEALGLSPDIALVFVGTKGHAAEIPDLIAPQGHLGLIEGPDGFDASTFARLSQKSCAIHFELMFTRSRLETPDMIRQHELLDEVAGLVESGAIRTTLNRTFSPISAATLRDAHALVESGKSIGKVVIAGWPD
jgi:zinc-binding alcohol dehydrogenase family protein